MHNKKLLEKIGRLVLFHRSYKLIINLKRSPIHQYLDQ